MPTPDDIQKKIIESICSVQEASGEQRPSLNTKSIPLKEVKGFDSPLGVVVTGQVAKGLGVEIPLDVNIFVNDNKQALTIEQSAAVVCKVMKAPGESK